MNFIHISTFTSEYWVKFQNICLQRLKQILEYMSSNKFFLSTVPFWVCYLTFFSRIAYLPVLLPLNIERNFKIFAYKYWKILKHIPSNKFFSADASWVCYSTFFSWIACTHSQYIEAIIYTYIYGLYMATGPHCF